MNSKKILLYIMIITGITASGWPQNAEMRPSGPPPYPNVRFAVLSDLHFYSTELGTNGAAFQSYLLNDRKLLVESSEILDAAIDKIAASPVDFVLIAGDMTKDGEAFNHKIVAEKLKKLIQKGKKVFIINGNHDIENGHASRFSDSGKEDIPSVTPPEFISNYQDEGFNAAQERDPNSLSYVVEPVKGLWILSMDSCRYRENKPGKQPLTAGRFNPETLEWIKGILNKAGREGKAVIGMMHHGILEHYKGNLKYYGEYVVENNETVERIFTASGLHLVFTGHYHAQDITSSFRKKEWLYDIETGSLATYPCPFRFITFSNQIMTVHSQRVESIPSHPDDFKDYARQYLLNGTTGMAARALLKFGLSERDSAIISPQIAAAYAAHLSGDENPPAKILDTRGVSLWGKIIISFKKELLEGWWHDLPPADNILTIDMKTGKVK